MSGPEFINYFGFENVSREVHEVSSLSDILLNFGRFQSTERKKSQIIKVNKSF